MSSAPNAPLTRRRLLIFASAATATAALAACSQPAPSPTAAPKTAPTAAPSKPAASPAASKEAPKPAAPTTAAKPAAKAPAKLEQSTVKYSVVTGLFDNIFSRMAEHKGFYKEAGLEVEIQEIASGNTTTKALLTGELDLAELGTGNVLIPASQGSDMKIIGAPKPGNNYLLYTNRQDINKPEDLIGKNVGHGGTNSTLHLLMQQYLEKYGIDPNKVNFVQIGSSTQVGQAVFAGKIDAGPSGADLKPESESFPNVRTIANFAQEVPDFIRIIQGASAKTIKEKPEMLAAFLTAYARGLRYGLDNKEEAIAFGIEYHKRDRASVEWSYDWYTQNKIINPNLDITEKQVMGVQELQAKVGAQDKVLPFAQVVDLTAQKRVVEALGTYKPKA